MFVWNSKLLERQHSSIWIVAVAAVASLPLAYYAFAVQPRRRREYPPGPPGLPLIGNLHQLPNPNSGELVDDKLLEWAKEYGLVYSIRMLGLGTWVIISDPELVRKIYVANNYEKSPMYKMFAPIVGSESILSVDKAKWIGKRKAFISGFSPTFLRHMVDVMVQKLQRLQGCIEHDMSKQQPTNMLQRSQTFASDVIVAVAFGEDWGGDVDAVHPARFWHSEIARLFAGMMTDPMAQMFGFGIRRQIRQYEQLIDDEMMRLLERRLSHVTVGESRDICSLAIASMSHDGEPLTHEDKVSITHQLKTFYLGGHDTTASTISWAIWILSQQPQILEKLRAELVEHGVWSGDNPSPTYEVLRKCTYLEAVIKETLRLYPPFGNVSRYTDDDDAEWNGYKLSGGVLALSIYIMGRHPHLWKDPLVFRPERFLDGSEEPPNSKYGISEKFTVFSKGPRDCIGKYFAMLEAKLAISFLVSRYDFECVNPRERIKVAISSFPDNGDQVLFRLRMN